MIWKQMNRGRGMLYIQKKRTPKDIKEDAESIKTTPGNDYAMLTLPRDTKKLRGLFDSMKKDRIQNELCIEQHNLCAYCMRRIVPEHGREDDMVQIEHYIPLSISKKDALDYQNFIGVCSGGKRENLGGQTEKRILCCDASRGEKALTINPTDKRQMQAIAYRRDGFMYIDFKHAGLPETLAGKMQEDINEVLCLNGKLNAENTECMFDTATGLVASRKKYMTVYVRNFVDGIKRVCFHQTIYRKRLKN